MYDLPEIDLWWYELQTFQCLTEKNPGKLLMPVSPRAGAHLKVIK